MLIDARSRISAGPTEAVVAAAGQVILGKERQIRLAIACILARGPLLIEDVPGVGKTTLSHALAKLLGLDYQRIQFTSDLLPADINRASPKAQSALLEAMEEHQVTAEGATRPLPEPFFVIATQNPLHQVGTFPLPESQLDRFLMRISLGYPDAKAERELLRGADRRDLIAHLQPAITPVQLKELQETARNLPVSDALLDYVQAVINHTRHSPRFTQGLSPRAGVAILRAAQAWALMEGRHQVLPEDVQATLPAVVGHRLHGNADAVKSGFDPARELIGAVPIP